MGITKKTFRNRTKRGGLTDTHAKEAGVICREDCADLVGFYNYYLKKHDEQLQALPDYKGVVETSAPFSLDKSAQVNNILLVIDLQNDFVDIPMKGLKGPYSPPPPPALLPPAKTPQLRLAAASERARAEKQAAEAAKAGPRPGTFSVMASSNIIEPLRTFIDEGLHNNSLKKVIFSRDWHDASHCSFQRQQGPFPTHCLTNGIGAAFTPGLIENAGWLTDPRVLVVYKGISPTVDSFGAFKYKTDYLYPKGDIANQVIAPGELPRGRGAKKFLSTRQFGPKCCGVFGSDCSRFSRSENPACMGCSRLTGGFKRREQSREVKALDFARVPFITKDEKCSENCDLVPFIIDDLGLDPNKKNNIYICGLAGDYCVRDTAINIANELKIMKKPGLKYEKLDSHIIILQQFTRYTYLPLCGLGGGEPSSVMKFMDEKPGSAQQAKEKLDFAEKEDKKKIQSGNPPFYFTMNEELVSPFGEKNPKKPINFYLFKTQLVPKTNGKPARLGYSIIPDASLATIIHDFRYAPLPKKNGSVQYCSSPGDLWHFISSDIDILKQYNDLNIKIIMPPPEPKSAATAALATAEVSASIRPAEGSAERGTKPAHLNALLGTGSAVQGQPAGSPVVNPFSQVAIATKHPDVKSAIKAAAAAAAAGSPSSVRPAKFIAPTYPATPYVHDAKGVKGQKKRPALADDVGAGPSATHAGIARVQRSGGAGCRKSRKIGRKSRRGGRKSCKCGHKSCKCGHKSRKGGRKSRKPKGRLVGVTALKNGRFRATFARRTLGVFDTAKQAGAAYVKAVKEDHDCCD